ncbi:hypothetical protein ACFFRR_010476 [Megaselia abdita]
MRNYYEVLESSPDSSTDDLKSNYKRLILLHHPDKSSNSSKGNEIIEAWNILRDEGKRKLYDAEIFQDQIQQSYNVFGKFTVSELSQPKTCRCSGEYFLDDETRTEILEGEEEVLIECSECSLVIQVTR